MKKVYIVKSQLPVVASDARYTVTFAVEHLRGKTWEFDVMSDDNSYRDVKSDKVKVIMKPDLASMAFPEDANRRLDYVMSIEDARNFWKFMHKSVHFWFALDMANQAELHGFDADLVKCMENCNGCVADVEPV